MRIIAGNWKGASLLPPADRQTRPILDRVKEAVFDILGSKLGLPGALPALAVLDLFAGTGSLGLEALSRGAVYCLFVERHRPTFKILKTNMSKLCGADQADARLQDAWKLDLDMLVPPASFKLVFVDPPYQDTRRLDGQTPIARLMGRLAVHPVIDPQASLVLRHPKTTRCGEGVFQCCRLADQRLYGDMAISFFQPHRD